MCVVNHKGYFVTKNLVFNEDTNIKNLYHIYFGLANAINTYLRLEISVVCEQDFHARCRRTYVFNKGKKIYLGTPRRNGRVSFGVLPSYSCQHNHPYPEP